MPRETLTTPTIDTNDWLTQADLNQTLTRDGDTLIIHGDQVTRFPHSSDPYDPETGVTVSKQKAIHLGWLEAPDDPDKFNDDPTPDGSQFRIIPQSELDPLEEVSQSVDQPPKFDKQYD